MSRPIKYRKRAKSLTNERLEVLSKLTRFVEENGYSPSLRELTARLNLRSASTVFNHLESLEREGLVWRKPRTPRAWKVTGMAA